MDHSIDATIARIQAFAADRDDDRVANILVDLMPGGGLTLAAGEDYQRARLLMGIVTALVAYCDEWESVPEPDALADVAAYAAMLNTIDGRRRKRDENWIGMADTIQNITPTETPFMRMAAQTEPSPTGASDALSAWAATEAERIFPTTDVEPMWWQYGGTGHPEPMLSPPGPGPASAYYSHIVAAFWGTFEQAADFYRRRRADNFPTPPVDSDQQQDISGRRSGYNSSE
jgi:hypothetical protein